MLLDNGPSVILDKIEDVSILKKQELMLAEYLNEIESQKEQISSLAAEKLRFVREIEELGASLEKARNELKSVESELEQHRARALKTLQEREKLISELRNNSGKESDDSSILTELTQLR